MICKRPSVCDIIALPLVFLILSTMYRATEQTHSQDLKKKNQQIECDMHPRNNYSAWSWSDLPLSLQSKFNLHHNWQDCQELMRAICKTLKQPGEGAGPEMGPSLSTVWKNSGGSGSSPGMGIVPFLFPTSHIALCQIVILCVKASGCVKVNSVSNGT